MPRPRKAPLFELGGQWLAREPGRTGFWRFWYDAGTQKVRRQRLGGLDLEAAKLELAQHVLRAEAPRRSSPLAAVMLRYHEERSDKVRSAKMARAASRKALAFFGADAAVCDLTEQRQASFVVRLAEEGASLGYIARIVGVIAAGIAHARIADAPIFTAKTWIARHAPGAAPPRRAALPTDADIEAALSAEIPEPLFRWLLISLATGARPEAALDLAPGQRRDGLLALNPPGRAQNKKHRPTVREPAALTPWLDRWEADGSTALYGRYVAYSGVSAVQTALARLKEATGLRLTAYSLRHKVTTVLRRAKRKGVTEDGIAVQLGHKRPDVRVTGEYGEFDPDYLCAEAEALDAWISGLAFVRHEPEARRRTETGRFTARAKTVTAGGG